VLPKNKRCQHIKYGYLTVHAKANKPETDKEVGKYVRK